MSRTPGPAELLEQSKQAAAHAALDFIQDGFLVGLGTGSTVIFFLAALGERVRAGLKIKGIPTSHDTARLAGQYNIPLLDSQSEWVLDVAVDGADQVDPHFNLIKGGGGALLREKVVAAAAKQFIVIIDEGKQVQTLGRPWAIPVEVIPFGWPNTARMLNRLGGTASLRIKDGNPFLTDNGNYILDFDVPRIDEPATLERQLNAIPGVVENGLFIGRTSLLIVGNPLGAEIRRRP